jgi:hypothetical protein
MSLTPPSVDGLAGVSDEKLGHAWLVLQETRRYRIGVLRLIQHHHAVALTVLRDTMKQTEKR